MWRFTSGRVRVTARNNDANFYVYDSDNDVVNNTNWQSWSYAQSGSSGGMTLFIDGTDETLNLQSGTDGGEWFADCVDMDRIAAGGLLRDNLVLDMKGFVGELANWTEELSDNERGALSRGVSAFAIRNDKQNFYVPNIGNDDPELDMKNNVSMALTGTATKAASPPTEIPVENYL